LVFQFDLLFNFIFFLDLALLLCLLPARVLVVEHVLDQDLNPQTDTIFLIVQIECLMLLHPHEDLVIKLTVLLLFTAGFLLLQTALKNRSQLRDESDRSLNRVIVDFAVLLALQAHQRTQHLIHDLIRHNRLLKQLANKFDIAEQLVLSLKLTLKSILLLLVLLALFGQRLVQK